DGSRHSVVRRTDLRGAEAEVAAAGPVEARLHARSVGRAGAGSDPSHGRRDDRRVVEPFRRRRSPDAESAEPLHQPTLRPPSTARIWPVTYGASLAKNSAARATSSVEPGLFTTVLSM